VDIAAFLSEMELDEESGDDTKLMQDANRWMQISILSSRETAHLSILCLIKNLARNVCEIFARVSCCRSGNLQPYKAQIMVSQPVWSIQLLISGLFREPGEIT
jgi:hypothetical protein